MCDCSYSYDLTHTLQYNLSPCNGLGLDLSDDHMQDKGDAQDEQCNQESAHQNTHTSKGKPQVNVKLKPVLVSN